VESILLLFEDIRASDSSFCCKFKRVQINCPRIHNVRRTSVVAALAREERDIVPDVVVEMMA
jgi:hypothetical protein